MVSVIIPTFNREQTILEAVKSVLNQSVHDLEVLIVDDGSTDNTGSIIKAIEDPRVKYIYQSHSGACVARNTGIHHSQGMYIAFHDSDDLWHMDKLEKQLRVLHQYDPDIVCCKLCYQKADGTIEVTPPHLTEGFLKKGDNLFGIGTVSLLAKREVFQELEFDSEFPRYQEMELLYRALEQYTIYCIDEGLIDCTRSIDSISANPEKVYRACVLIAQKHPELLGQQSRLSRKIAWNLLQAAGELRADNKKTADRAVELSYAFYQAPGFSFRGRLIKMGVYDIIRKIFRVTIKK